MGNADSRGRTPFAERMFQARMRLGWTQMQVCEELGIMHGTISLLETTSSTSRRTDEFARLYRCDPHWLATGAGSPGWDEQSDAVA
jgi:transcriptional regulator with XRE-family HTH domain